MTSALMAKTWVGLDLDDAAGITEQANAIAGLVADFFGLDPRCVDRCDGPWRQSDGHPRSVPIPAIERVGMLPELTTGDRTVGGYRYAEAASNTMPVSIYDTRRFSNLTGDERQLRVRQPQDVDGDVESVVAPEFGNHLAGDDIQILEAAEYRR
jgi:hypothetical protein